MPADTAVPVLDAVHALAFIGDLSMGQPIDHSQRTAWLSARLAEAAGFDAATAAAARQMSLLRWSGCTANAPDFDALIGDDVGGRALMLARRVEDPAFGRVISLVQSAMRPLTDIHCEVSGDIAHTLGMAPEVEHGLRWIFERCDGHGPRGLAAAEIPPAVHLVAVAGDLEVLARAHGLPRALAMLDAQAGSAYPEALVALAAQHAKDWLARLDRDERWQHEAAPDGPDGPTHGSVALELVADVIDLKLPWMAGHSRRVAEAARQAAALIGLTAAAQARCHRAGLIHGMGRAAVPNAVWDTPGRLTPAAREQVRLVPYWTARAAGQVGSLAADAEVASYAGERLDGSGAFRNCGGAMIPPEGRVLAAAAAWVALRSPRPWRRALPPHEARTVLQTEAQAGRFDADAVHALCGAAAPMRAALSPAAEAIALTAREIEIFRGISLGQTNKEVARALDISPSTVRTHVENVFRKLDCTTRAAATLKASALGLI